MRSLILTYEQSTGNLYDDDGRLMGAGYSGHGKGVNNQNMQSVKDVGPIPCGIWVIGSAQDSPKHGPIAFPLTPHVTDQVFGRGGFWLHGDSKEYPGTMCASLGCIIMGRGIRMIIEGKQQPGSPEILLLVIPVTGLLPTSVTFGDSVT